MKGAQLGVIPAYWSLIAQDPQPLWAGEPTTIQSRVSCQPPSLGSTLHPHSRPYETLSIPPISPSPAPSSSIAWLEFLCCQLLSIGTVGNLTSKSIWGHICSCEEWHWLLFGWILIFSQFQSLEIPDQSESRVGFTLGLHAPVPAASRGLSYIHVWPLYMNTN